MTKRCGKGHEMTPETTYTRPSDGYAECQTCRYARREKSNAVRGRTLADMTPEQRERKRAKARELEDWRKVHRAYLALLRSRGITA